MSDLILKRYQVVTDELWAQHAWWDVKYVKMLEYPHGVPCYMKDNNIKKIKKLLF